MSTIMFKIVNTCLIQTAIFMSTSTRYLGKALDMNHMLAFSDDSQRINQVT